MLKLSTNQQGLAHPWIFLVVVIVVVSVIGMYVGNHNSPENNKNNKATAQSVSRSKLLTSNLNSLLPINRIQEIATEDQPGATVTQVGLVQTAGGLVYHVELEDGSFDLDAQTGDEVMLNEVEDNSEGSRLPANFTPSIDFAEAGQIAQTQITSGSITRIQLETKGGQVIYSVRFSTGAKVEVSANDGSVLKTDAKTNSGSNIGSSDSISNGSHSGSGSGSDDGGSN